MRFYRINARGDRRYRVVDLQRFLAAAEQPAAAGRLRRSGGGSVPFRPVPPLGATIVELRTRPTEMPGSSDGLDDSPAGWEAGPLRLLDAGRAGAGWPPAPSSASRPAAERRLVEMEILGRLADQVASGRPLVEIAQAAVDLLHDRAEHDLTMILERRDGGLRMAASRHVEGLRVTARADEDSLPARALVAPGPVAELMGTGPGWLTTDDEAPARMAVAIPADGEMWGVLVTADATPRATLAEAETFLVAVARQLGVAVHAERLRDATELALQRAETLRRTARELASEVDVGEILDDVLTHAHELFGATGVAVVLRNVDGVVLTEASRGLDATEVAALREPFDASLGARAIAAGHPLAAATGAGTTCVAPFCAGDATLGFLTVHHAGPQAWDETALETLVGLVSQAGAALANAQRYQRMATWATHLQSIQQLGARLARLTSETEIGAAIANELDQLIEYHNVRVYRLRDDGWLIPVAMRGLVGEFHDETPEQLLIRVGQGITGWVAEHRVPENLPDAAHDPRAMTIPGTDDLDESMLLAPLIFEDAVLGIIVLSKLGLRQFSDDDLRLLVIYASLAAQAMANAASTELLREQSDRLAQRLAAQRALLEITGSILEKLDLPRILGEVADRLTTIVHWDNISIEWVDAETGRLTPMMARGIHASEYLQPWGPGEEGLATWVLANGIPQLVRDELADPRIHQFPGTGDVEGSIISVPLLGRDGVRGVLSLERLGGEDRFGEDDFELVQLFTAQVSIAIRNAEAYRQKEIEAETDDLTGLLNQGTFGEWLDRSVEKGTRFGLLMLDLDQFKTVNDTLGHQAGDDLLRSVATTISHACRGEADRVFRYGGDEFAVICPSTEAAGAIALAERIRGAVASLGAGTRTSGIRISASIGVATFPEYGPTAAEMLLAADRACFVAKRRGRNQIATAEVGLALAGELTLHEPTPFDPPEPAGPGV